jgi:uncharacterized RDD family membrane protein YckC
VPGRVPAHLSRLNEEVAMASYDGWPAGAGTRYDPAVYPELFDGVLSKRVLAFVIDAFLIAVLMIPAALIVLVLGILTLGLGWLLFGPLFAIVALGYMAITGGGRASATIGMRLCGVEMRTLDGGRLYPLLAAVHALLFWLSVSLLTPLILLVGLFSNRSRLLHDILLGVIVLNADALHRLDG